MLRQDVRLQHALVEGKPVTVVVSLPRRAAADLIRRGLAEPVPAPPVVPAPPPGPARPRAKGR